MPEKFFMITLKRENIRSRNEGSGGGSYKLYNIQGDITGLLDSTGSQVVRYQYNSLGKH